MPTATPATTRHPADLPSIADNEWLRFDRNVSAALVHRKALAEILVTDTVQVADDEFLLGTQLPRAHIMWSDRRHPYHDPLIAVEIGRQACIAVAQRYYKVKVDWQFVSKQIDFQVVNLDAFTDNEITPSEGVLRARFSGKRERHGVLSGITAETELTIGGVLAGLASGEMMFFARIPYERLRSYQRKYKQLDGPPAPTVRRRVDPALVGRVFPRNVTIGEDTGGHSATGQHRYVAIIDQGHPYFFDHPLDHVPGGLVLEVYRQAAIAAATTRGEGAPHRAVVKSLDMQMDDFAEFEAPVECTAAVVEEHDDGGVQLALAMYQLKSQIGDARVALDFV